MDFVAGFLIGAFAVVSCGYPALLVWRNCRAWRAWKEDYREGLESAIEELPAEIVYTGGVFRFISSSKIKQRDQVAWTPSRKVRVAVPDDLIVLGRATEDSVPIPDDPDGLHEVTVALAHKALSICMAGQCH